MYGKLTAVFPYAWGNWKGEVDGVPAATSRTGFADPLFKVALNFLGARAVGLKDFAGYREGTVLGSSLTISAPLGQYDPTKLINLGTNRWAFRPRVGISRRIGRWTLEALADAWFYTENREAFGGTIVSQSPMGAVHGNIIYAFSRGYWVGFSGGVAGGGETAVNGVKKDNSQTNSRFGLTLAIPLNKRQGLRISYLNSIRSLIGADFDLFSISYQYRWGGGM
jgi:hypothetical protein